jgi:uncharacterized protein DUF4154
MTRQAKCLGWGLLLLAFSLSCFPLALLAEAGDSGDVEARVKGAFVFNFARFIEWPPKPAREAVRIAVVGRGDLAETLEEITRGKTVNSRSIEVIKLPSSSSIPPCDILFMERTESKHVKEIVQTLAGKPVLTVCDGPNCSKDGAMIAFRLVDESVRFQINQEAAEKAGLKISSQLLKVALPAAGDRP